MRGSEGGSILNPYEEISFQLILHGGNARAEAYSALKAARDGDFTTADEHLKKADEELKIAHEEQAKLIQDEAGGTSITPTFLLVHAHGHVMTAIAEKNLIEEMIEILKKK